MIRIGLSERQKQKVIHDYIESHDITQVYCFYFKSFPIKIRSNVGIEYYEYKDIIEYKPFYHLLEVIDQKALLIFNECMRTQSRSDLTYNCAHHYCNQTPHKIVFEYFPIIDTKNDLMILLDFINKGKYKGKSFDYVYLQTEDILIRPRKIKLETLPVATDEKDRERYEKKKEQFFAGLGNKDPDTIPRNLQILAGDIKKKAVGKEEKYVARNKRFKMDNVLAYNDISDKGDYTVIDFHFRRLNFNDFLKTTGMTKVKYLCTTLPVDNVLANEFVQWKARLDAIYAQTSLY